LASEPEEELEIAEACFNTNRQCIGSEINEDYAKESLERMKSL
jgi:DNA modification methylase